MSVHEAVIVSVSIARDWHDVYRYLAIPENCSNWASGLGSGVRREGDRWVAAGPDGPISIRFSAQNSLGVADHVVELADGREVPVPMRVVPNGTGSLVSLTLFKTGDMDGPQFESDAAWVLKDLQALKKLLET